MIFNKEIMDSTQNFFFRHLQSHFTSNMTVNSYIRHVMYLSSNHVKSALLETGQSKEANV